MLLLVAAATVLSARTSTREVLPPDGTTIGIGDSHVCALQYKSGLRLGGVARCWGLDYAGQVDAPEVPPASALSHCTLTEQRV
jgi:hypothetical protein